MKTVRKGARITSQAASWDNFIKYYDEAYALALEQANSKQQ